MNTGAHFTKITESAIEGLAIDLFEKLGYQHVYAPDIAPNSETPERERFEGALSLERLRSVLARINPSIPAEACVAFTPSGKHG